MPRYLFIESRDPFESADVVQSYELAVLLAEAGHTVTLFLVQNGVLPARRSGESAALTIAARAGVEVLADEFSLRERGIPRRRLCAGVRAAPLALVIDQLAQGRRALFC
jgi:sulfur relay (sulfurtransferase) complex TusBCD TusD component (DsrE family)